MKLEDCVGKRCISGIKLAQLTGYHKAYVSRILRGDMEPGVKFLKALDAVKLDDVQKRWKKKDCKVTVVDEVQTS